MSLQTTLLVLAAIDRAVERGDRVAFAQGRAVCTACLEDMVTVAPKTWSCTRCGQVARLAASWRRP